MLIKRMLNQQSLDDLSLFKDLFRTVRVPDDARLFAVGDLHGCYSKLMQELTDLNFNFSKDVLIAVGDLVDRGKENVECLNLLNMPWFHSVMGNHDLWCITGQWDKRDRDDHCEWGGAWFYQLMEFRQKEYAQLIADKMPVLIDAEHKGKRFGFLHGDIPVADWDEFKDKIKSKALIKHRLSLGYALWGRGRIEPHPGMSEKDYNDLYQQVVGVDAVFLGHTVVDSMQVRQNCVYLDTGYVFGGGRELTVIEIGVDADGY